MPWERARNAAARSDGDVCGHGPSSKALRAAATARSTSASEASGTTPMTSSVAGDTTSMVFPPAGATHSPPMYRTSRFSTGASSRFCNRFQSRAAGNERADDYGATLQLGSYRAPVGEAAWVVAAEGAVLEQAPTLGAVAGGPGDVIDHTEGRAGHDLGVVEVVDLALGEVLASPLAMAPVGVAAVAGTH